MSRRLFSMLPLALLFSARLATASETGCADRVEAMRDLHWQVRQGRTLDNEQQALWRTWNQDCASPQWQAWLVREDVPVQALAPTPASAPGLTWRDYAATLAFGVLEGMTRQTVISCSSTTVGRGSRTRTTTHCY